MVELFVVLATFALGFWAGYEAATARGVRFGYAAGLRHAKNMLRRKG